MTITTEQAIQLLQQLIAIPSFSKEEQGTASLLFSWLGKYGIAADRIGNNIIAGNKYYDSNKPVLLLNSHHDTVKPATGYTRDPFDAAIADGKLFGLGSNDAGGSVVSLVAAFLHFYERQDLPYNIMLALTAEEEISGAGGISMVLPQFTTPDCAIVGEPTLLQMAVAERGLLVLDCTARGKAGHAARNEGENAIYKAMQDIEWFRTHRFDKISALLGPVTMQVTSIDTPNKAHNVVPDSCRFTVDIRVNEQYTHEEILGIVRAQVQCDVNARGTRLRSSTIAEDHPLVQAGKTLGLAAYGSPTLSDKALLPCPAIKLGPGDSARSHMADEYLFISEVTAGIDTYIRLLEIFFDNAKK
jgi:acetylornithine deacetylase